MEITTAKVSGNGYVINGGMWIPNDANSPYYKLLIEWQTNGGIVGPEFTDAELLEIATKAKWDEIERQRLSLTVTTSSGNKYAANQTAISYMINKESAMSSSETITWYESWGSFQTDKVELQEAILLASTADQTIIDTVMGL